MTDRETYEQMLTEIEADYANYKAIRDKFLAQANAARKHGFGYSKYHKKIAPYDDLLRDLKSRMYDVQAILDNMEDET